MGCGASAPKQDSDNEAKQSKEKQNEAKRAKKEAKQKEIKEKEVVSVVKESESKDNIEVMRDPEQVRAEEYTPIEEISQDKETQSSLKENVEHQLNTDTMNDSDESEPDTEDTDRMCSRKEANRDFGEGDKRSFLFDVKIINATETPLTNTTISHAENCSVKTPLSDTTIAAGQHQSFELSGKEAECTATFDNNTTVMFSINLKGKMKLVLSNTSTSVSNASWMGSVDPYALGRYSITLMLVVLEESELQKFKNTLKKSLDFFGKSSKETDQNLTDQDSDDDDTANSNDITQVNAQLYREYEFPELDKTGPIGDTLIKRTSNSAVCLSGGGVRAMCAATGQMRALKKLRLLSKIRYQSAVSGGGWATTAYLFRDPSQSTDNEFLGQGYIKSKSITMKRIRQIPDTNFLKTGVTNYNFFGTLLKNMFVTPFGNKSRHQFWNLSICERFLHPFGVKTEIPITYNSQSLSSIRERNSFMRTMEFAMPREGLPFPIINKVIMSPCKITPVEYKNLGKQYGMLETTPLMVGVPIKKRRVKYIKEGFLMFKNKEVEVEVYGGTIEPIGFHGEFTSAPPIGAKEASVKCNEQYCLRHAAGNSSAVHVGVVATLQPSLCTRNTYSIFGNEITKSSPNLAALKKKTHSGEEWVIGDGGMVDNFGIISCLRRKVENIICCMNTFNPLPAGDQLSNYTPLTSDLTNVQQKIDQIFCAFFGYDSETTSYGEAYNNMQCFRKEDFFPIVENLERKVANDEPVVHQSNNIEVIDNENHGVRSYVCNITWVYLSMSDKKDESRRRKGFNALLSDKVFSELQGGEAWPDFPNYKTMGQDYVGQELGLDWVPFKIPKTFIGILEEELNLLSHFTCWTLFSFFTSDEGKPVLEKLLKEEEQNEN